MRTLYVVKDGVQDLGSIVKNGKQIRNTNFYLLTYGINNEGYIEEKSFDTWRLYTQVGEKHVYGSKKDYSKRYFHFPTLEDCIEKLNELAAHEVKITICELEEYQSLYAPAKTAIVNTDEIESELQKIIGLDNVKEQIRSLIHLAKVRKAKEEKGIAINPPTLHMVFYGNPGTGKTMIARLISTIYYKLGLLETDSLIEASRSDLVGKYIGHTAVNTTELFHRAIGGVLFIDEAYSLLNESANDFGHEAISTLIKLMEDNRDNTVVIIAGYTKQMKNLLESNPGFMDRFSTFIHFSDYTKQQIHQIIHKLFDDIQHQLTVGAKFKLELLVDQLYDQDYFKANARSARNLYDKIYLNQANRIGKYNNPTKADLTLIFPEDIPDIT